MILGKSFNLFVYKMRGSGHLVPLASFQLFSSIISFDGEGPTAYQLKGVTCVLKWDQWTMFSALLCCHSMIDFLPTWSLQCSGTFCTHCTAFARPVGSSVFLQSLKTGLLPYYLGFCRKDKLLVYDLQVGKSQTHLFSALVSPIQVLTRPNPV